MLTRKLQAFADRRGYVMLDQFSATDIDVFYSTSKLGIRSRNELGDMPRVSGASGAILRGPTG